MFYDGGFNMSGLHGLGLIFWLLVVGVLVLYGWGRPGDQRRRPRNTPHGVLQRRLANGEIAQDEYEKRKSLLDQDAGA